ncbi:MAG: polyprenyl synthetase family protein [Betaproteobacteria bacterium]|nr:polyprenyl synthetase family protein [Betaproteobacteria bacterium]
MPADPSTDESRVLSVLPAEDAHDTAAVEWWFLQGWFAPPGGRRREFMTSFFRLNLRDHDPGEANGFEVLLALYDPGHSPAHRTQTWISPPVLRQAIEKLHTHNARIDPFVQRALLQELVDHGPPRPVVVNRAAVSFRPAPLDVAWDGYRLAQRADGMHLEFRDLHGEGTIALVAGAGPGLDVVSNPATASPAGGMAYRTYPRLPVLGRTADGPVAGEAWLDHQWGDFDWFRDPVGDQILGWDWFGINLDHGSDVIVLRHFHARSRQALGATIHWRDAAGVVRSTGAVTVDPRRHWESPATHAVYPVGCRIDAPEFDLVLDFEPLADDQEVPSFGTPRAVWEGAGTVTGRLAGQAVRGRARGEFHGYAFVLDHGEVVGRLTRNVDRSLEDLLPRRFDQAAVERFVGPARGTHEIDAYTAGLAVPVWDLIDRSGKRWRPLFGLLLLESLGVPSAPYAGLIACMTEMVHTATLIVDDIEDDSLLRRGAECLHLRYGVDVALNAGNALYFLPSVVLFEHPLLDPDQRWQLLRIKERMFIEGHCGQATDIHWSRRLTRRHLEQRLAEDYEGKLLQMYALKTASAASGVAECAAVVARAGPAVTAACSEFARTLGTAFQIVDDVQNFASGPIQKQRGEDLAAGKVTFPMAAALRALDPERRSRLAEIVCSPELRQAPDGCAEGIALIEAAAVLEPCRRRAITMVEEAWRQVTPLLPPSESKILLHALCLKLVDLAEDV